MSPLIADGGTLRYILTVCYKKLFLISIICFAFFSCSYTPDCNLPSAGELSNPSDLIEYNNNILIVNTDASARFCNGYVSEMNMDTGEMVRMYNIGNRDTSFLARGALWRHNDKDILLLTERGNDSLIGFNLKDDKIEWRINLGDDPLEIRLDETRGIVLVTNLRGESVSVVDLLAQDTPVETVRIFLPGGINGYRPNSIDLSEDMNRAYVTGRLFPVVYLIDMNTLSLESQYVNLATTVSGLDNRDIKVYDGKIYVVMRAPPAVAVINEWTNTIENFIPVKSNPDSLSILPGMNLLFVSEYRDNTVLKIDLISGNIINEVSVGDGPAKILITSDGRYLFTANYRGNTVSRIDLNTWEVKEFPEQ